MFQEDRVRVNIFNNLKLTLGISIGKFTVCQKIVEGLQAQNDDEQKDRVTVIAMDNFYKPTTTEQREQALRGNYNLDHPRAFDENLLLSTLKDLLNGETVKVREKQNN